VSALSALLPVFPGYSFTETLLSDPDYILCRATREADGRRVLVRTNRTVDGERAAAQLLREFEFLRRLDIAGVLQPLGFETYRKHAAIVFEDFAGCPLIDLAGGEPMALSTFLSVAAALAEVVGEVHARRVVCKQLTSASVLVDLDSGGVKLFGFTLAETLTGYSVGGTAPNELEGSLTYLAPEQTGRLNYGIDSRSDLYALGVIFYRMLTGSLPFVSDSPAELVYAHIARQPEPPAKHRSDIPDVLSRIVLKLLAKDPAARYQSAFGLGCDLNACVTQLRASGHIGDFEIGARDVPQDLRVPSRLYGRQAEIELLRTALQNSVDGSGEIVLIAGGAGVGKSMLAREVGPTIATRGGHFAAGKFDQLRRDIPYSALIEAFHDLVHQILAEGTERFEEWRRKLAHALSGNAQIIVNVLPELRLLLGPQPPAPPLAPVEATARFNLVISQFVRALATSKHPLVLLLDDMQWADSASVNLLRLLIADPDIIHLMLIFAYRDNEVQPFGPLDVLLDGINKVPRPVRNIQLRGLKLADVGGMLQDTLRAGEDDVAPLARLVFAKTQGNAFFVKEFITSLYRRDLLYFESRTGQWRWNLAAIAAEDVTENVVDLVAGRLGSLPDSIQRAMQFAAAIGSRFTDETLATVCEQPLDALGNDLVRAEAEQLIASFSPPDAAAPNETAPAAARRYRFVHDRIQQAAYGGIPVAARPALHERIGRLIKRACGEAELEERLFEVVNHLNIAASLPEEEGGRTALMAFNLRAVRKAKSSAAHETAWRYLEFALGLADAADWQEHYEIAFGLHREAAEVSYLLTHYAEMQRFSSIALERARGDLDRVEIYEILIRYYNSSMQYTLAVETGLKAASILGEPLPENPTKFDVIAGLARTRFTLFGKSVDDLRRLPAMTDPKKLAAMRVMSSTASASYFARPMLLPVIVFGMLRLSVQHGVASLSAFAYVCYGFLLCALRGDMDNGFAYGQLALDTLDRFNANELRAKIVFLFNVFIYHWKNDLGSIGRAFLEAAASGIENGDLEFFSYNLYMHCSLKLIDGQPLDEISETVRGHYLAVAKHKQDKVELLLRMFAHVVGGLRGAEPIAGASPAPFDEKEAVRIWLDRRDYSGIAYWYCFEALRHFGLGDYQQCVSSADLAHRYYDSLMGQPYVPFVLVFQSLALGELLPELHGWPRHKAWRRLAANRRKLARWADSAPSNYLRKARLLEAEWQALRGRPLAAMRSFDEAVALAARDGSLLDEGVASERAAKFALSRDLTIVARSYLDRATACYARWGAPSFRAAACAGLAKDAGKSPMQHEIAGSAGPEGSLRLRLGEIDIEAIMRATRTLSQQVVLADVLRELLTIAIENAGATRGLLLLVRSGAIYAEAEAEQGKHFRVLHSELVDASRILSKPVLDYALRTGASVTLNNAAEEGSFTDDPYIRAHNVRSLMCVPLHNQGEIIGLLYLENRLTGNVFSTARLEMVRIFAAQAAISIRNAELYANLERSLAQEMSLASVHKRFVPHQFLVALGKHRIADVAVGDQILKTISVLFADMRAYSSLSERMTPKENMDFVNTFFGQIESAIVSNRGFIENYYGDGIMALFDGEADDAVKAGIALLRSLNEYNETRKRHGVEPVRVGIGINTGEVMLGTIGAATSIKCSVIGDAVNFARRIENLTKHFNCPLLVGEPTYRSLKDATAYRLRNVGRVRVKGHSRPETIYEVFDADSRDLHDAKLAMADGFRGACDAYYARDFMTAASAFQTCLTSCPTDTVVMMFLERCRSNALGVPPDWDGADSVMQL
jgi:predicted ATPase/class 3 adenylate cyclase